MLLGVGSGVAQSYDESFIYVGPRVSVGIVSQSFSGGLSGTPYAESIPSRLGSGYGVSIGFVKAFHKHYFMMFNVTGQSSFDQNYQTRATLLPNGIEFNNEVHLDYLIFSPSFGLSQSIFRNSALRISIGPDVGIAAVETKEGIAENVDGVTEGTFWDIKGGYTYGFTSNVGVSWELTDRLGLLAQLSLSLNVYKPQRKVLTSYYSGGESIDLNSLPQSVREKEYTKDIGEGFESDDVQPIPQEYFNFSNVALTVTATYSL